MPMIGDYRFLAQERVIFGRAAADAVAEEAGRRGGADQQRAAAAMGRPDLSAAEAVQALVRDLGQPATLREVRVERVHFEAIIEGSLTNLFVSQNPRAITDGQQIREILEMAY